MKKLIVLWTTNEKKCDKNLLKLYFVDFTLTNAHQVYNTQEHLNTVCLSVCSHFPQHCTRTPLTVTLFLLNMRENLIL